MASGPLSGVRVVEWAHVHLGPGAGMFLSDMGADVIHVETPAGDAMRHYRTLWGAEFLLDHDRNTFTEDILRNKQSLTVDLRHEEAREIVRRLADDADVFITNYRPQAAVKNELDHETLLARNPRLVYAHGTSYGMAGPDRDAPGLEMMGLAKGGIMLGSAVDGDEPVYPTMGLNDRLGAIGLLVAILSALVHRERTGEGQLVETSLLGWAVNLQSVAISYTANTGQGPTAAAASRAGRPELQRLPAQGRHLDGPRDDDPPGQVLADPLRPRSASRPRRRPALRRPRGAAA